MIFLNSASSASALVFYLPISGSRMKSSVHCEVKTRESVLYFKIFKKNTIYNGTPCSINRQDSRWKYSINNQMFRYYCIVNFFNNDNDFFGLYHISTMYIYHYWRYTFPYEPSWLSVGWSVVGFGWFLCWLVSLHSFLKRPLFTLCT